MTSQMNPSRPGELGQSGRLPLYTRVTPIALFFVLCGLTLLVWKQQVDHRHALIFRNTQYVCAQTAHRLEEFIESRLAVVTIFGRRWATHGGRDFSYQRFEEFASLLIQEMPGFRSIHLVEPPGGGASWSVPARLAGSLKRLGGRMPALLERAQQTDRLAVSEPVSTPKGGETSYFAALALKREQERLGFLVVELEVERILQDNLPQRIRSEFSFELADSGRRIFASNATGEEEPGATGALFLSTSNIELGDRSLGLALAPLHERGGEAWRESLPIPLLGILLAVGLSWLVHLLFRRVLLYRNARDQTLFEMAEREKTQNALLAFEARHKSFFESATDGFLILDPQDRIVEANAAASAMHGFDAPERLIGRSVLDLISPAHRALYRDFKDQLATGESARLDFVNLRADGTKIDVELRGTSLSYGGEPRHLAIMTDVSDRKRVVEIHTLLSRKVLMAQEEERARVSRELHDELGQIITAIRLELGFLKKHVALPQPEAKTLFQNSNDLIERAANELRHICRGLRPPLLDDLGLEPAAHQLIEEFEDRTGISVEQEVQLGESDGRMPAEVALCTYRILQESLNNISRHAQASRVDIQLVGPPAMIALSVKDDGRGFELGDPAIKGGCGLAGMHERANLVSGSLEIRSARGLGTQVEFRVELAAASGSRGTGAPPPIAIRGNEP
jgi:PAS domain S-box-containing protein